MSKTIRNEMTSSNVCILNPFLNLAISAMAKVALHGDPAFERSALQQLSGILELPSSVKSIILRHLLEFASNVENEAPS